MSYEQWCKTQLTEKKVLTYLQKALKKQNPVPETDKICLIKRKGDFIYKGYSTAARRQLKDSQRLPVPIYRAVYDNTLKDYPGYEKLLSRKRAEYERQNLAFAEMEEDPKLADWLNDFSLWDSSLMEQIQLNGIQKHDINLTLQKQYALLQWEQGS